jgi:peptidoglycan/xylan/chitin deacetylase (PgdA/CDA1 family)
LIGNVTYNGEGISNCVNDGDIALTFDDGPFNFTGHLLDVLASYDAKATFFITGNNLGKGQIDVEETGWPETIRRMHREGHQIAAHTWTHQKLSSLNSTEMENQMHYLEMALRNILGFIPTYMRPPYSECDDACQALMRKMGYHITYQNLVTFGTFHYISRAMASD